MIANIIKRFSGGIHPPYNKFTKKSRIEVAKLPERVILPMQQHIGAPAEPLVKTGDEVRVGQKIGEAKGFVSANVHASISGIVEAVGKAQSPLGSKVMSIVIKSDGRINWDKSVMPDEDIANIDEWTKEKIINKIKEAGIVGLGGAAFPTHVKLTPPLGKKIDTIILNGAECEPYLSCDHRLMLERSEEIVKGLKIIMKATGASKAYIGIEDNKVNALGVINEKICNDENIEVVALKTKYPQGAEKMLIYAITKKVVPAGGLPLDVSIVVNNVGTAKAIYDAVYEGKPLVERVLTVAGAVNTPKNMLVKIGTPVRELIEQCGGAEGSVGKIILGGPMMGIAQYTDMVPVIKGTSGVLLQKEEDVLKEEPNECIRCARCIKSCPMNLMPNLIGRASKHNMFDAAENLYAMDCFECGCCSYVCPSKIPLVHLIKNAKNEIIKKKSNK